MLHGVEELRQVGVHRKAVLLLTLIDRDFSDYFEKRSLITFTMLDGEKFGLVAGTWEITL